jgi:hypothetical protein
VSSLSLQAKCWQCGKPASERSGACTECSATTDVPVPIENVRKSIYDRQPIWQMLSSMRSNGALESIDDEIAALRVEAQRLMTMEDMGLDSPMSEVDRASALRTALTSTITAVEKRQKIILEGKYYITLDFLRVFLGEVDRVLRRYIKDENVLRDIGTDLASISLRFNQKSR